MTSCDTKLRRDRCSGVNSSTKPKRQDQTKRGSHSHKVPCKHTLFQESGDCTAATRKGFGSSAPVGHQSALCFNLVEKSIWNRQIYSYFSISIPQVGSRPTKANQIITLGWLDFYFLNIIWAALYHRTTVSLVHEPAMHLPFISKGRTNQATQKSDGSVQNR